MSQDKGRPLPKFGEWDVNDPASAEGFTVIFNKARDERKTGGNTRGSESPVRDDSTYKPGAYANKPTAGGLRSNFCRRNGFAVCNPLQQNLDKQGSLVL